LRAAPKARKARATAAAMTAPATTANAAPDRPPRASRRSRLPFFFFFLVVSRSGRRAARPAGVERPRPGPVGRRIGRRGKEMQKWATGRESKLSGRRSTTSPFRALPGQRPHLPRAAVSCVCIQRGQGAGGRPPSPAPAVPSYRAPRGHGRVGGWGGWAPPPSLSLSLSLHHTLTRTHARGPPRPAQGDTRARPARCRVHPLGVGGGLWEEANSHPPAGTRRFFSWSWGGACEMKKEGTHTHLPRLPGFLIVCLCVRVRVCAVVCCLVPKEVD
jgi:hypothetical protein